MIDADLASYLRGLAPGAVAVHLDGVEAREAVLEACVRAGRRLVALHDGPEIVVTADGVAQDGVVRCLKDEVDEAAPGAERVIVIRVVGDAPLAATMDAYLDVEMTPGRDVWLDDLRGYVGASG